jgi:hypothetical protein
MIKDAGGDPALKTVLIAVPEASWNHEAERQIAQTHPGIALQFVYNLVGARRILWNENSDLIGAIANLSLWEDGASTKLTVCGGGILRYCQRQQIPCVLTIGLQPVILRNRKWLKSS